ncbi:MAG: RES family NAD+ phosphorylase [Myxococcota bacterium]|nr:RES family NAD+ phosphorylase [Myxococcota bacterium]
MSLFTESGGASRLRRLELDAFRVVESQHVLSTRKLVDSDDEQVRLETLVERVKPPVPPAPGFAGLHYLLFTPFRHPPLRWGSRFGRRDERGIFYGSKELATAFAEVSYYRLLFLEGTSAALGTITVELTAFAVSIATRRGIDLTRPPFRAHEAELASRTSYAATQALGTELRGAGVEVLLFRSARAERGVNVALFAPAFVKKRPSREALWICTASRDKVELSRKLRDPRGRLASPRFVFPRALFETHGALDRVA